MTFTIQNDSDVQAKTFADDDASITDYLYKGWKYSETKENDTDYTAVTHYGFTCDLTSIQMADEITAVFGLKDAADSEKITAVYSVKKYLDTLIENATDGSNLSNLAKALKDYGHYAQITLSETNTVYGTHTEMDKADSTKTFYNDTTAGDVKTAVEGYAITKDSSFDGLTFTLELNSKIDLIVYFPGAVAVKSISVYDAESDTTKTLANDTDYKVSGNSVTIYSLSAHELANEYTITADTDKTVTIYGLSYVKGVLDTDTYTDLNLKSDSELNNLKNAVIALYNYCETEIAYRKPPND